MIPVATDVGDIDPGSGLDPSVPNVARLYDFPLDVGQAGIYVGVAHKR